MAVFEPKTNQVVENYRNLVQDQSIAALAYDLTSELVFGGTNISGGGGTTPRATEAVFFAWDAVKKEKVLEIVPVSNAWGIVSMCVAEDKIFFFTWAGKLSVFDILQNKIVHQAQLPYGRPVAVSLDLHSDGLIYGLSESSIFTINPTSYQFARIAQAPISIDCGWALTNTGIYFGAGVNLWKYHLATSNNLWKLH